MTDEYDENYYEEYDYQCEIEEENVDNDVDKLLLGKKAYSTSYSIVKHEEMETLRNNIIAECSDFTYTNKEESISILMYFQWNLDGLKDNWYNGTEEHRAKAGLDLSVSAIKELAKIGVQPNNTDCFICYTDLSKLKKLTLDNLEIKSDWSKYYLSLNCSHNFCCDCWAYYVESRLDDILTLVNSNCPQVNCNIKVPEKALMVFTKSLNDEEKMATLKKAILKNFTDFNKDMKWCPAPGCGICIRSFSHYNREIECECGTNFCFSCGKEGHRPCQCEMVNAWDLKNSSESENVNWLLANTKQCPQCKKFIEKNQGCNHMTCRQSAGGCGYEFCWICLGEWKPHGSEYYKCNSFDPSKFQEGEKKVEKAKFELAKYSHFFTRYMNHEKAKGLAAKLRDDIKNYIKEFITIKKIPLEEVVFLNTAIDTVIKARIRLKNTYIFGYYLIDCKEKSLFEYQQKILEREADLLHEYLEGGEIPKILKLENFEDFGKNFTEFKVRITNLYSVTQNYMNNLINDIEMRMLVLVDYNSL